jgi:acetyl-CoA carboxylase biotin carboxylase subunit
MQENGVPVIPGMTSGGEDKKKLKKFADEIGYPVIIKAAAGGGGKGMRIIESGDKLIAAAEAASREAEKAFGNGTVYLEKYLEQPRHIEFQIFVDNKDNAVHLFERECSIQRRYQKIVEETPSPALDQDLRQKMGETAKKIALLAGYRNAGTVEFLLDQNKNFYFLEMNTRIQVEHPITEMTTGIDLVVEQLRVAAGENLSFNKEWLRQQGHAIECRIYAEDPENNFLPSPGHIDALAEPSGPGVRVDSGIYEGFDVPFDYDPILSKLVVYADNREMAISKMLVALDDYKVLGIKTAIPFLKALVTHDQFRQGNTHTKFIEQYFSGWKMGQGELFDVALVAAAIEEINGGRATRTNNGPGQATVPTPWQTVGHFRLGEND